MLVSGVQQSNSVIHICVCVYILFRFLSTIGYYKILNIVLCVITGSLKKDKMEDPPRCIRKWKKASCRIVYWYALYICFFFFLKGKYMHNCWNKPRLWKETLEMVHRDCFGGGTEEG